MLEGTATAAGTAQYARRFNIQYRSWGGFTLSSLGLGTYLGGLDAETSKNHEEAAVAAIARGVNVLTTAANYREQLSERELGRAIMRHVTAGGERSELFVVTKAGYLHGDASQPGRAWFDDEYVKTGVLTQWDVVAGSHSLKPEYIKKEIDRSRRNLGIECIDLLLIHNPETQLAAGVPEKEFYHRMREAFRQCERAVDSGKIKAYGVATWDGLRVPPGHKAHLSLARLMHEAGEARMAVRGKASDHHFRAIELPVNPAMPEAASTPSQPWPDELLPVLECATRAKLLVLAAASLMQAKLVGRLPAGFKEAFGSKEDLEACLQFTRSVPGVTTALVGMGSPAHVMQATAWAAAPALPEKSKAILAHARA
jgi:aryl-alcohol dehydrogenase-like predicted oxidoreductase